MRKNKRTQKKQTQKKEEVLTPEASYDCEDENLSNPTKKPVFSFLTKKSLPKLKPQKKTLFDKPSKKIPITFNLGLTIILFFCYLSISIVAIPTSPALLLIILPTIYIFVRYMKLEREVYNELREKEE